MNDQEHRLILFYRRSCFQGEIKSCPKQDDTAFLSSGNFKKKLDVVKVCA